LKEVSNPSLVFLGERVVDTAGNVVTVAMEGTRPILLEVQSLTSRTPFGMPRRMVSGYDLNRIIILIAVLEKRLDLPLEMQDIFVNIVGGMKVKETSLDLACACAIASANSNFICSKDVVVFGEVGLAGELRSVALASERISEAEKLGFIKAVIPKGNLKNLSYKGKIKVFGAQTLGQAIKILRN
jgi:DNA repair protein RadA/Sms